jgi:hypothetical protein
MTYMGELMKRAYDIETQHGKLRIKDKEEEHTTPALLVTQESKSLEGEKQM